MPTIGEDQPVDVDAEPAVERVVGEVGEDADQRALEDDVGHRRQRAGGHAPHLAEAVGDEAVERAGRGDVARHRDEADGEQGQHDRRDQEAGRGADAVAVADRDRGVAGHRGDRRGVRHGDEQDAAEADGPGLQGVGVRRTGATSTFLLAARHVSLRPIGPRSGRHAANRTRSAGPRRRDRPIRGVPSHFAAWCQRTRAVTRVADCGLRPMAPGSRIDQTVRTPATNRIAEPFDGIGRWRRIGSASA